MREETLRLRRETESIVARALELAGRLDDKALYRRPAPGSWSIAECLEHLSVSAGKYARRGRKIVEEGNTRPAGRDGHLSLFGKLYVWLLEPPARLKLPAPKPLRPQSAPPRAQLLEHFKQSHAAFLELIDATDTIDRTAIKIASPISKKLKLTMLDMFTLGAAHGRRHLWQAERIARL